MSFLHIVILKSTGQPCTLLFLKRLLWLPWISVAARGLFPVAGELSSCGLLAQSPQGMWDLSSLTRDQTCVSCIAKCIPNPWTTREVPQPYALNESLPKHDFTSCIDHVKNSVWLSYVDLPKGDLFHYIIFYKPHELTSLLILRVTGRKARIPKRGNRLQVSDVFFLSLKRQGKTNCKRQMVSWPSLYKIERRFLLKFHVAKITPGSTWT